MKNGYLRVLINVAILLSMLFAIDVLVGWCGRLYMVWLNKMPHDGDAALVNYNLNAATPDVAIIGSSTALCHYNPDIIRDSLKSYTGEDLQVFNMGMSNQRMAYNYYGLKCLLERATPQMVIVDVWASYLDKKEAFFSFGAYKPYVNINHNVKEMFLRHEKYSWLMKSNMYCYNTELVKLVMSAFKSTDVNGFTHSVVELDKVEKDNENDTTELLPLSVEEFDAMLSLAKENNVMLFVVLSPTLCSSDTSCQSYQYMKKQCSIYDIPFMDYSNDTTYYKKHYFRDKTHLNSYGAELFTNNFMKNLRDKLRK